MSEDPLQEEVAYRGKKGLFENQLKQDFFPLRKDSDLAFFSKAIFCLYEKRFISGLESFS